MAALDVYTTNRSRTRRCTLARVRIVERKKQNTLHVQRSCSAGEAESGTKTNVYKKERAISFSHTYTKIFDHMRALLTDTRTNNQCYKR